MLSFHHSVNSAMLWLWFWFIFKPKNILTCFLIVVNNSLIMFNHKPSLIKRQIIIHFCTSTVKQTFFSDKINTLTEFFSKQLFFKKTAKELILSLKKSPTKFT